MKIYFRYLTVLLFCGLIVGTFLAAINSPTGQPGRTGSPADRGMTCIQCHDGHALNSGSGSIKITSEVPVTGYTPGQTYAVSVTVAHPNVNVFGFDFEALTSANTNAGTLAVVSPETKLLTAAGITNVVHSNAETIAIPGSKTFTFNWTAPAGRIPVTFYASGNAASATGYYIYTTTLAVAPQSTTNVASLDIEKNSFSVYPMPAIGNFHLSYMHTKTGNLEVALYNINGNVLDVLYSQYTPAGDFAQSFDLSAHPAGMYFIKVKTDTNLSGRIMVLQ